MNAFTTFLHAEWAERAGWTLLHSLWQIAAIATVYATAAFLLRNRSANSRYVLGCAAMFAMLGLPLGTFVFLTQAASLGVEGLSNTSVATTVAIESPGTSMSELSHRLPAELQIPSHGVFQPGVDTNRVVLVTAEVPAEQPVISDLFLEVRPYMPWATAGWLSGVLLLSFRPFLGWVYVHRLRRRGHSPLSAALLRAGWRAKERLGVDRAVEFVGSVLVEVPIVIGSLRPMILLPASAISGLSVAEIELILAHELAHVRRHDWLFNLAQTVIEVLLFFHPAMWWVSNRIRKERENCCDDMVVRFGGDLSVYVRALVRLEERRPARPAVVLAATDGALLTRVRRLLGQPTKDRSYRYAAAWLTGLIMLMGIGMGGVAIHVTSTTGGEIQAAERSSNDSRPGDEEAEADTELEPKSWEISKLYDPAWLRHHLGYHEMLPKPITVPAVRGTVVDAAGETVANADVQSHTPRQWVPLETGGRLVRNFHGPTTKTDAQGRFGLPQRTEPYRVLVVHDRGIMSISHEELIHAGGQIILQPWARMEGVYALEGEPRPDENVTLHMNTLPWSYTPGGPRLTLPYVTTTDEQGRFIFDRLPPLDGRVYAGNGMAHGVRFRCESGKTVHVVIGEGRTVTGRVSLPVGGDLTNGRITVKHDLPNPPYPEELVTSGDQQAMLLWQQEWNKTAEGQAFSDETHVLSNLNYSSQVDANSTFVVQGVPAGRFNVFYTMPKIGRWKLSNFVVGRRLSHFMVDAATGPPIDLGVMELPTQATAVTIATPQESFTPKSSVVDPHYHGPALENSQKPNEKTLPSLQVQVTNESGHPIAGAHVSVYDRNHYMAGMEQDFKRFSGRTDRLGRVDLGVLPQDDICIEVHGRENAYDSLYTIIFEQDGEYLQTKPHRAGVKIDSDQQMVTAVFKMRKGVDLAFEIVDRETGEPLFFPQVYYRDEDAGRWWTIALIDAVGQHNVIPCTPELSERQLRAAAVGYRPVNFRLKEQLKLGGKFKHRIEMDPLPEIRFTVLTPDGDPAPDAQFRWIYPVEFDNVDVLPERTDRLGQLVAEQPANAELSRVDIMHASGRAELHLKDLPPAQFIEEGGERKEAVLCEVRLAPVQSTEAKIQDTGRLKQPSEGDTKLRRTEPLDGRDNAANLAPPVRVMAGDRPIEVAGFAAPFVGDFDGDGKNDLLVGQYVLGRLRVYRNVGSNSRPKFHTFEWFKAGGRSAGVPLCCRVAFTPQLIDFDGDGRTDILSGSGRMGEVFLFRRRLNQTFDEAEVLQNGDGEVLMHRLRPDGKTWPRAYNVTALAYDWDKDGDTDLLLGYSPLCLVLNEGTTREPRFDGGRLVECDGQPIMGGIGLPQMVDWDGDGLDDLLTGSRRDIVWYRNVGQPGRPEFEAPRLLIPGLKSTSRNNAPNNRPRIPHALCVADFNSDGRLDLLLGDHFIVAIDEEQPAARVAVPDQLHVLRKQYEDLREGPPSESRQERIARYRQQLQAWQAYESQRLAKSRIGQRVRGHVWLYERIAL